MKKAPNGGMPFPFKGFLALALLTLSLLTLGYPLVQRRLAQPDVRRFVEAKAGELLKVEVKIGGVRYVPPLGLGLEEIKIPQAGPLGNFSIDSIRRLVFSYGFLNLLRRQFSVPGTIRLDSPEIHFSNHRSPFPLLLSRPSSQAAPSRLVIEGGKFRYPWGGGEKEVILSKVSFSAKPLATGQMQLRFTSELAGAASGRMEVRGTTDARFRRYELEVQLKNAGFLAASGIPLEKVNGSLRVSERKIEIKGFTSLFHDWEIQWGGAVEDWRAKPKLILDVASKKGKPPFRLSFQMNFESEKLIGNWSWGGRSYPFQGSVRLEERKILFPLLQMPHGYGGHGELDSASGDYDFWFERGERRFHLHSNLSRLEFETDFQLDHAAINHLDWVVLGKARFRRLANRAGEAGPRFGAEVETEYLIVEYEPLDDFRGSFELSPEGVEAIDFRWGGVFHLGGRILFRGGEPREDLLLRVDEFSLETIRDFAGRPIPSNLRGMLEGKLKLRGALARPEIQGYFTIKDGSIEKLDFDRAIIQFQGSPPQLRLYDSKIFRGRSTLRLMGVIDLRLKNIFHGVQIQRSDHLVIWKGMSVYWKEGESAIEGEKPLGKKITMGFEVGAATSGDKDQEQDESHALVGPKVKF